MKKLHFLLDYSIGMDHHRHRQRNNKRLLIVGIHSYARSTEHKASCIHYSSIEKRTPLYYSETKCKGFHTYQREEHRGDRVLPGATDTGKAGFRRSAFCL